LDRTMSQGVLILSGYNIRAVVAFCRWATARGVPFHLVARDESDPIFLTDYAAQVLLTRASPQLTLAHLVHWSALLRAQHGYERVLLLPSTEFLNRFMLAHREELEQAGCVVPLVGQALYCRLSDKYSFGRLCSEAGIAVPVEYDSLPERFPFVAKPRSYAGIGTRQLKPHLVYGPVERDRFLLSEDRGDFYYQQYVDGRSLYLLAYVPINGQPVLFSQENLVQQPEGGSVILARADDFHLHADALPYLALLARVRFHGLIMIEVRRAADGTCYMIEANPRLWGPMQLVVDHQTGIFDAFLADYGFGTAAPAAAEVSAGAGPRPCYYWSGGLRAGPPSYHHFSAAALAAQQAAIAPDDIFHRHDSMPLYRHEQAQP